MALSARRRGDNGLDAWPGYVDALSTLLMVIIFVLLVFVLGQAFLSVALSGRDQALDRLNRQVAELTDMLSLEKGRGAELQNSLAAVTRDLQAARAAGSSLTRELAALREQAAALGTDRDALRAERDRLAARLADAELESTSSAARIAQLQEQAKRAADRGDEAARQNAALAIELAEARRQLAEQDRLVQADKATVETRLSDIAKLAEQVRALTALRDDLERQAREAATKSLTEEQKRQALAAQLAEESKVSDSARAQIALLNRQVAEMRSQLTQLAAALDVAEKAGRDKDAEISNLGQKLNAALASKVEELQRYRSEFFGRLREVLANRPGVQISGDRFVFQSEVLFPVGSADLTPSGVDQIRALAATCKQIAAEIPHDLHWVLRVDGHADRQPVTGGGFPSNWELSSQRAINVVKRLIAEGVPPAHLAAAGFADYQPVDTADTPEAYARNRRIELRLTDR